MKQALFLLALLVSACGKPAFVSPPNGSPTPQYQVLQAEDVIKAFKAANLPLADEIIYSPENDPNKLLGRPNQYIGKANWNDQRYKKTASGDNRNCTVEVFDSAANLENRRKYVEAVTQSASIWVEYAFVHKNALLRLSKELTPAQAAEFEKVLKGL